jgi:hypothetical protein
MADEKNKPKAVKKYYTIKIETLTPVEITCKVLAEDANEALELVLKAPVSKYASNVKPILSKAKKVKATICKYGSNIIELIKRF